MAFLNKILTALGITSAIGDSSRQMTPAEWVSRVSEDYAGVAAGVEINKRCSILSAPDASKLEQDLDAFTEALSGKIHPEYLTLARNTARDLAADEPYKSCGSEAREAITEAQEFVAWWLKELGGKSE
jgi:hypothetical protein